MNMTMALPSLRSDSPSMTEASFAGAPSSCKAATTATGSVALTMAPRSMHTDVPQSWPNVYSHQYPVRTSDRIMPGKARKKALPATFWKTW